MMADMQAFDEQMPCVGIFWYDPAEKVLFGVRKQELTPKMTTEAAEKGLLFTTTKTASAGMGQRAFPGRGWSGDMK